MCTGYNPTVMTDRGGNGVPLIYSMCVYNLCVKKHFI